MTKNNNIIAAATVAAATTTTSYAIQLNYSDDNVINYGDSSSTCVWVCVSSHVYSNRKRARSCCSKKYCDAGNDVDQVKLSTGVED